LKDLSSINLTSVLSRLFASPLILLGLPSIKLLDVEFNSISAENKELLKVKNTAEIKIVFF